MTKKPYATRIASTEIRQKIMDFIVEYRKKPPYFQSPTMQEIALSLPLSKTSVYHHLCYMEREGLILRSRTARGIVPAPPKNISTKEFDSLLRQIYEERWDGTPEPLEDIHARVKQAVKCESPYVVRVHNPNKPLPPLGEEQK